MAVDVTERAGNPCNIVVPRKDLQVPCFAGKDGLDLIDAVKPSLACAIHIKEGLETYVCKTGTKNTVQKNDLIHIDFVLASLCQILFFVFVFPVVPDVLDIVVVIERVEQVPHFFTVLRFVDVDIVGWDTVVFR